MVKKFETRHVPSQYDDIAPDDSEIRLLVKLEGGSMSHCTLPPQRISQAVRHQTVEELWYFVQGCGQVWRRQGDMEEVVDVRPGVSMSIPVGVHFQFRNTGWERLCFIIVTMPPWPGEEEAVKEKNHWEVDE